jgi:hypothetical protein
MGLGTILSSSIVPKVFKRFSYSVINSGKIDSSLPAILYTLISVLLTDFKVLIYYGLISSSVE